MRLGHITIRCERVLPNPELKFEILEAFIGCIQKLKNAVSLQKNPLSKRLYIKQAANLKHHTLEHRCGVTVRIMNGTCSQKYLRLVVFPFLHKF